MHFRYFSGPKLDENNIPLSTTYANKIIELATPAQILYFTYIENEKPQIESFARLIHHYKIPDEFPSQMQWFTCLAIKHDNLVIGFFGDEVFCENSNVRLARLIITPHYIKDKNNMSIYFIEDDDVKKEFKFHECKEHCR